MRVAPNRALAWLLLAPWLAAAAGEGPTLVRPVAVPLASGPAFPQGRQNGRPPDPTYAADKAMDGDPATFCCLLDDTLGGPRAETIPAHAAEPVTGHMVFDLGASVPVCGIVLTSRADAGPVNPKSVDAFCFADDAPAKHPAPDDIERDAGLRRLAAASLPPLRNGEAATLRWPAVTARYVGLRVNSSYESGGIHHNFQLGEVECLVALSTAKLPPAVRPSAPRAKDALEKLRQQAECLRLAVADLAATYGERYRGQEFAARLAALREQLAAKAAAEDAPAAELRELADALAALQREALVTANPLLSPGKLLFVKRFSYSPGWYYADFMRASRFGGNLCVLSLPDGRVTELVPRLAGGIFDRYDLSFDGRRVVFGYKAARGQGFRLWEVGTDGSGLRQLTVPPPDEAERIRKYAHPAYGKDGVYQHHTDDFHPCYLPDGGLVFASTRCERGVLCDQGDSLSVNVLYRMDADGSGMRCLSQNALSESTPTVTNDGRVLYTRWEYVDKGVIASQELWAMRPDGTGTAEVYGNEIESPPVLIQGRAIPGASNLFVCTATLHHPFAVGPILRIDARADLRSLAPITNLTPDTNVTIEGAGTFPTGEAFAHLRNGRWVKDNVGPLFADPYPLADPATGAGAGKYFLVVCNPDQSWSHPTAYALWLLDVFGNRVPIYRDPAISCWQPMPLAARPRPPVLPSTREPDPAAPGEATLVLSDVYAGLDGVPRGTVKYLRVLEQVPRPWAARRFWPHDEALGQQAIISLCSHIHVKLHHGVVPVHPDGSAHFTVPADRSLFFQALDENFMEVQRMRSFVNLMAGERRSCLGCHEPRGQAPPVRTPLALRHPPARPAPQPGESVPRPIHYPADVQPVLDKHCVRCHSTKDPQGGLDLSGELTTYFSRSYEALFRRKLLAYVQEFYGPQPDAQKTNVVTLPPRALGSAASKLIAVLRKGHEDVKLSEAELVRLITWADANGPYYGTYFGRRNLMYREHPDFRPTPK